MKKFNRQYKIVQVSHNEYKVYYKRWFFWCCYVYFNYCEKENLVFYSWDKAEKYLLQRKQQDKNAWEKKNFPKVERLYPPNKLPGEK